MKHRIIALMLTLIMIFLLVSCEKEEAKADTVYYNFFGSRFDLSDKDLIVEFYPSDLEIDYSSPSAPFGEYVDAINDALANNPDGTGATYMVARLKCTGDMRQRIYSDEIHYKACSVGLSYENAGYTKLYTDIPFEVVEIFEGDKTLLKAGDNIEVHVSNMYLGSSMITGSSQYWQDYDYTVGKTTTNSFRFNCPRDTDCITPRIGYEYVVILRYSPESKCYRTQLHEYACELSTPEDYIAFKSKFDEDFYGNERYPIESKMPDSYWEILERYNITIE